MAGLVPAIHVSTLRAEIRGCPALRPGMTANFVTFLSEPTIRSINGRRPLFRTWRGEDRERGGYHQGLSQARQEAASRTSIRATRRPRRSSRRSPPPTASSATRKSAGATIAARSTRPARRRRSSAITANMPAATRVRAIARARASRISARSAICSAICSANAGQACAAAPAAGVSPCAGKTRNIASTSISSMR